MVFAVIVLALIAAAFVVGVNAGGEQQRVLSQDPESIIVTAVVESRAIGSTEIAVGEVSPGASTTVPPPVAGRAVVTAVASLVGTRLQGPSYLASANNRPLFALPLQIPLFRDLSEGDSGADVTSLRAALGLNPAGTVDWAVKHAVANLYREVEACAPADCMGATALAAEFAQVPAGALITNIASVGTTISDENPFVSASLSGPVVTAVTPMSASDLVEVGDVVTLVAGRASASGAIAAIGEFTDGAEAPAGYPTTIGFAPDTDMTLFPSGTAVTIRLAEAPGEHIVVPTSAVRSDDEGTYVVVVSGKHAENRVGVQVVVQDGGFVGLRASDLKPGDRVRLG